MDDLISKEFLSSLLGMSKVAAEDYLAGNNFDYRITCEDNESFACTCDWVPTRINLEIENGVVKSAHCG